MFQLLHTINQKERCTSTDFNNNKHLDYLSFTEGVYLKIFNINDINYFGSNEGVNSKNSIKARDTIIQSKFSDDGKSIFLNINVRNRNI